MSQGMQELMADLVLGPVPDDALLDALCRTHAISAEDARALHASLPRLAVYRELVRGNLKDALSLSIPRSIARLGAAFDEYFDRFLREHPPGTHYLRDVTTELLEFCRSLWASDERVPSYLYDLARHEALHIEVSALPAPPRGHVAAPLALDQGVELSAALRLVHYRHAVHELPDDEADRSEPSARPVALLVYRSPEHEVRYLELTPLASAIIERLLGGEALGRAIQEAAAANDSALTEAVLSGAAQLLADLAERGVLWGPKPARVTSAAPAAGPDD